MTLIEFIGFVITMIAFFLLIWKQARDERRAKDQPREEYRAQSPDEQEQIAEILKSLDLYVEDQNKPSPPPKVKYSNVDNEIEAVERKQIEAKAKAADKNQRLRDLSIKKQKAVHQGAYQREEAILPRASKALKGIHSLQDAVILAEILGPPQALKRSDEHF